MATRDNRAEPGQSFGLPLGGWRGLGLFWLVVLLLLAGGGLSLLVTGPPSQPAVTPAVANATATSPQPVAATVAPLAPAPRPAAQPGRSTPGPIADPDPALLEPMEGSTTAQVPRIADDGRMPMQVYAAGFDRSSTRPRIGLVVADIDMNQAESEAAIHELPRAVTLAFSPYYKTEPSKLLEAARLAEHEYLLSIPMEPQGFPLNDPGPQALMTSLSPEQNHPRLEWALSRLAGYVGATGALGSMAGERFASLSDTMTPILKELAARGLLYVDPRPAAPALSLAWGRSVDLVVDEPSTSGDIDAKLSALEALARQKGSALGLVTAPHPVAVQHIVAWADKLIANGLALAPVSALVRPP